MLVFFIISCDKKVKNDFQIMQNDALRFCNNTCLNDKISLVKLHKKAKLASLEQRRCIQLLSLMYKLSKNPENRTICVRQTRQNEKYVFRFDNKVGTKYHKSSYYKGGKLWNMLEKDVQLAESIFVLKAPYKKPV